MANIENSKKQHEPIKTISFAGEKVPSYIKRKAKEVGIDVVELSENPQVIISYGGDGTFLGCLRDFEQPILPMRRNEDYRKCRIHTPWNIFEDMKSGRCTIYNLPQIVCEANGIMGESFVRGYNDITLRPVDPRSAIRFKVKIGSSDYGSEIVGDGIVACTPFGSSAYFRSITRSIIRGGWGLAFNNSCEQNDHLFLSDQIVKIEITRGPACIFGDNSEIINLDEDQKELRFYLDNDFNRQCLSLDSLFCKECQEKETGRPAGWRHS